MTDDVAIHTEGLTKRFGEFPAVVDVDLDVRRGEVFGFLGPNGAGKTTTIRMLTDELRPSGGRASILGLDCQRDSVAIRSHLGYLPGDLAMYPRLTGRELVTYFANLRGGVDEDVVALLVDRLDADLSKRIGELSSGNRQKIGLIQAFMNEPDVLVMDEPSTGLDPLVQREFQTMMREVADEGRTVFLSSHTLGEVQRVADRVGIIRRGELVAVEGVAELRAKAIRSIELTFDTDVPASALTSVEGVREVTASGRHATVSFDGTMHDLLAAATSQATLLDIRTAEADLEEIFLAYYRGSADPVATPTGR